MVASRVLILFLLSSCYLRVQTRCPQVDQLARSKRDEVAVGTEDELQKARLEFIKSQILQRLGLSKVPKVKRKQMDIAAFLNLFEVQQQKQEALNTFSPRSATASLESSAETDKVFVSPVFSTHLSTTFNLTLSPQSPASAIKRIVLFLKQEMVQQEVDREISVFARKDSDEMFMKKLGRVQPQPVVAVPEYENEIRELPAPWFEYDLTSILMDEVTSRRGNYIVINPKSKKLKFYSALITIEFEEEHLNRRKRSVDCSVSNSSSCCRESFYVNFTTIGWDNWILQPSGYSANYCKGQCDISHARYHHSTVVQKYQSTISLCCSPREMSHISLIYVDEDGFVYQKILQNMTVESCDCA